LQISENFKAAIHDYSYFLEKRYPERAILELVATRYSLDHFERSILYRGITKKDVAEKRKNKLITIEQLNNRTLHIDLFNVLFTIAAYLRGFPVYIAQDGFLRDASESHGKGEWEVHLARSLDLLMAFIDETGTREAILYIDNILEFGPAVAEKIRELVKTRQPGISIISDLSPDHLLKSATNGIIATSDSIIIDRSGLQVLDLPGAILGFHFQLKLLRLDDMIY
jgi:hypothetical protein